MNFASLVTKLFTDPGNVLRAVRSEPWHVLKTGLDAIRADMLSLHGSVYKSVFDPDRIEVMEEDWDTLILLDACRYDLFEELYSLPGQLERVYSQGSATVEFVEENFGGCSFPDTVYVCANPNLTHVDTTFHEVQELWETDWDDKLRTVPPESVTEAALDARQQYPDKRLIVHYIQPHYPFIGKLGREIEHATLTGMGVIADQRDAPTIWNRVRYGSVSVDTVWQAYRENAELLEPHVQRLLDGLPGKLIVTSDHGNAFGEYGEYGHRTGVFFEGIVEVPWLVVDGEDRPKIRAGEQTKQAAVTADVEDRLADLGYR